VDALIAANPDLNKVILLSHMQQLNIEQALAERLRNVDIIVAGGSNTRLFDADDSARPGDSTQGTYPIIKTDADGKPVAVVNTDGNYKYLGRLVLDFDANGNIIPGSYDASVSGAYRTDAAGLAALDAEPFIDARVQEVADNLRELIVAQESEWFGISEVFLNGNRNPGVRSEETNLGNITADANLAYARTIDSRVLVSLKNGGGIRNSIGQSLVPTGSVDGKPELLPTAAVFDAHGNVVKPEGGISRNDIANALSFNNGLSLVTVTATELKALIEFGVAAGEGGGRFPQVGGIAFSYDLTRAAGERVLNMAIQDEAGNDLDIVVRGGDVVGDPARTIRMVTLNFLASGGDGYPFTNLTSPDRVDLTASDTAPRTGVATFAADGSEQDALAEFLAANHSPANPFTSADTPAALDTRLQNLAVRSDEVIDVKVGTTGDDDTTSAAITLQGFDGKGDILFTGAGNDLIDIALTGGGDNTIFTGSGANTVFAGTRDLITGGSDSDQIWAIAGNGNRLSGMGGNDDFVIGTSGNRALGGDDNDKFTILDGAGTNYLNGGAGSDQFWLISAPGDKPGAKQFVMDFKAGEDLVGLRGVAFADLSFNQVGTDTLLSVTGTAVGHFTNVSAASLNNQANFVLG
jgi:2',3'-cyclic-nucleotide 2'-phosphodiesterase (5'-nucleotidase family)